jgi:hypothetical protein
VADGFLAPGVRRDALDGQVNFDEAFAVWHRDVIPSWYSNAGHAQFGSGQLLVWQRLAMGAMD